MSIFDPAPSPWPSRMLSILRIVTGATFITFGTMKLFNIPPMPPGQPPLEILSMVGIAGILEVFGGLAFTLGLFTRPVAFVLSGEMAFAYFIGHAGDGFWPVLNNGALAVIYCFLWLYISAAGGGPWSLDAMMRRR